MVQVFNKPPAEFAEKFGQKPLLIEHNLHKREMFTDAGLASLLDRYPRDQFNLYTMNNDQSDQNRVFRRGYAGDLSGAEILDAIYRGRLWLNLRAVNQILPDYDDLCDEMFDDMEDIVPGLRTISRDCGVLISSPNARVFYHLDIPRVSLWQIRGSKNVHVYPTGAPFASDEQIEGIILGESEEEIAYRDAFDESRTSFKLAEGNMLTWPQMAPHKVENDDCVNISLSCEFMTVDSLVRANAMYFNGMMRRKFGTNPNILNDGRVSAMGKAAAARAIKLFNRRKHIDEISPVTFEIDLSEEYGIRDIAPA